MNMSEDTIVYIRFPGNMDVVYGRGGLSNNQEGNKIFRELIMSHKDRYESLKDRTKKNEIATKIVSQMRYMGSRFLQYSDKRQLWYDSGDFKAVEKTKQRFRELREPRVRNKIAHQDVKRAKTTKERSVKQIEEKKAASIPKKAAVAAQAPPNIQSIATTPNTPGNDLATLPHRGIIGVKLPAIQSLKDRKSVAACNSSVTASELDEEFRQLEEARSRMRSLLSSRVKEEDHRLAASYRQPLVRFQHQSGALEPSLHQHHSAISMQDRLTRLYAASANNRQPTSTASMPTPQAENLALRRSMMNSLIGSQLEGRTVTNSASEHPSTSYQLGTLYDSVLRHPPPCNEETILPTPRTATNTRTVSVMAEHGVATNWSSKSTVYGGEEGIAGRSSLAADPRKVLPPSSLGQHPDTLTQFSVNPNVRIGVEHTANTLPDMHLRTTSLPARWREQEKIGLSASVVAEPINTRTMPATDGEDSQDAMQNNNGNNPGGARTGYSKTSCGSSMDMSSLFSELSEQFPDIDKVEHRLSHIAIQDLDSETVTSSDGKTSVHHPHRQCLPGAMPSRRSVVVETVDVVFTGNEDEREQTHGSGVGGCGDNDSARSVLTMSDLGTADLMLDDDGTTATGKQYQRPQHHHQQQQHRMGGYYRSESGRSLMSDSCFSSVSVGFDEATTMSQEC